MRGKKHVTNNAPSLHSGLQYEESVLVVETSLKLKGRDWCPTDCEHHSSWKQRYFQEEEEIRKKKKQSRHQFIVSLTLWPKRSLSLKLAMTFASPSKIITNRDFSRKVTLLILLEHHHLVFFLRRKRKKEGNIMNCNKFSEQFSQVIFDAKRPTRRRRKRKRRARKSSSRLTSLSLVCL